MRTLLCIMLIVLFVLSCSDDSGNLLDNQNPGIAIIECTYDDEGIEVPSWTSGSTILAVVTFTDSVGTETDTLNVSDNLVTGEVLVRAASGYLVEVNCYNSAHELTWSGSIANVIIESDKELFISMILSTQLKKYTLSGTVTGTSGVTVYLTGDADDSLTVNDGESYSFTVLEKRNYTVTPTKSGYSFTPADITFDNVSSSQTQNFSAEQNTYTVSGTVSGSDEVTVTLRGDAAESQMVNEGGTYSFTVVEGGSYTVTPSKEGYGFSPEYKEFSDIMSDESQDFRVLLGTIEVTSSPAGANILLDGDDTGEITPFTFTDRPVGEYTIGVTLDDHTSEGPKTVTVSDGQTAQVSFTLTQLIGSIEVTSAPSGAKISLDGVDTGEITPFTFTDTPVGEYTVDVSLEGNASDGPKSVMVTDGQTAQVSFTLTQLIGSIEVTSAPSGAKISLGGVDTGEVTPFTFSDEPVGEYTVDVSLDGYTSDGPKSVTVTDGKTAQVSFTLTQLFGSIEVTSAPSGAKILLGGVDNGEVTPSTISDKPVGEYTVDVSLDGYTSDGPKTVTVTDGKKTAVDFILTQDWHTLSGKIEGADSVTVVLSGDAEDSRKVYDGGSYSFIVHRGGSYTVSPAKDCYEFTPAGYTFENVNSDMSQDFIASQITNTISGTVTGADSVTVVLSGDASESRKVDDGGSYSFTVACGGNYTVTASHPCYEITPADAIFNDVMLDGTQDFTAAQITYTITGSITGIDGITVRLEGDSTDSLLVDDGGSYSFTVGCGGSYTVTPVKDCYEFTPADLQLNAIMGNAVQDFSAALSTYDLTGTVTGSDYVTVTLGGDADEIQIVDDGDMYSFTVICGGNYSIIPSKPGHKFTPNYIAYNNVRSDKNRNITTKPTGFPEGLELTSIPGGSFQMGSENGLEDEMPVHTVTLDTFEMSVKQITNEHYSIYLNESITAGDIEVAPGGSVVGTTGLFSGEEYIDLSIDFDQDNKCWIDYTNGTFSVAPGKENWPVVGVAWFGAKAYALFYGADIPTEAEWEYAAKGGQNYEYGTDDGTIAITKANIMSNNGHPVDCGSYPPNPFGLYDMSGNVWEWCHDWYGPYEQRSADNPTGAFTGTVRVKRGGGWINEPEFCRTAHRSTYNSTYTGPHVGFRIVKR